MIARVSRAVLVVDDDAVFRGLARRILAACELVVVGEAASVEAAIELAGRLRPDGVLVDLGLPDGDGVELAERLSALPWHPRVVLTSSGPDAASPEGVRRAGVPGFVAMGELPNAPLAELLGPG